MSVTDVTTGDLISAADWNQSAQARLFLGSDLTISGGAITPTDTFHRVLPESGTTDDLSRVSSTLATGFLLVLKNVAGNTITVKDGTDNLSLVGDFVMDSGDDTLLLVRFTAGSSDWLELSRSNNS